MRLLAGLAASGLVSLALAISDADGAIFDLRESTDAADIVDGLTAEDAELVLAQRLGVTRYHSLGVQNPDDRRIEVLSSLSSSTDMFSDNPTEKGTFILSLSGILDSNTLPFESPAMRFDASYQPHEWLAELAKSKAATMDEELETESFRASFCSVVPDLAMQSNNLRERKASQYSSWRDGSYTSGQESEEMLQAFKPDREEDIVLVEDYLTLDTFIQNTLRQARGKGSFAFCHFSGLEAFVSAYGADSSEVSRAISLYTKAIKRATEVVPTILIVTPPGSKSSGSKAKRAETPLSMASSQQTAQSESTFTPTANTSSPPAHNFARCHTSQDQCSKLTNACSNHGICQETFKGCWACACKPSVSDVAGGGKNTTHWAGNACQKKDISLPFNIFFVFTILFLLVIYWAIGLLYSIGNESLPSVLSSGVAPVKRA